jgi:hypothetical protein
MTRRRVIEANDAADDRRRGHSRGADQTMALAVRDQRKVSGPQVTGVRALDFEPALPGGDDVEHHHASNGGSASAHAGQHAKTYSRNVKTHGPMPAK